MLALGFEESVSLGIPVAQYLDLWEPVSVEMSGMGLGLAASTMHGCLCPCGATAMVWLWSVAGPPFLHLQDRFVFTVDMGCH